LTPTVAGSSVIPVVVSLAGFHAANHKMIGGGSGTIIVVKVKLIAEETTVWIIGVGRVGTRSTDKAMSQMIQVESNGRVFL
jgi:hypothetical protein